MLQAPQQAHSADTNRYAGFWIRSLAYGADFSIILITLLVISVPLAFMGPAGMIVISSLSLVGPLLYFGWMQASKEQATYGKALLGLKVEHADSGGRISFARSLGRELAKFISALVLFLGFVAIGLTKRKQGLHDALASTVVVRDRPAWVVVAFVVSLVGLVVPMIPLLLLGGAAFAIIENLRSRPTLSAAISMPAPQRKATVQSARASASASPFVAAVIATSPRAYYRLGSVAGASEVGTTRYSSTGGVVAGSPASPIGGSGSNSFARFDGKDGFITTTQAGGIAGAGTLLAWVELAQLPAAAGHILYIVGESERGNDFDLQFETDNAVKFYTAAGSHLAYGPPQSTMVGRWHMIVASFDTQGQTRALYWDGRLAASDRDAGKPNKTAVLSIGASPLWGGRFFNGGIDEVALWDRALSAGEVASLYDVAESGTPQSTTPAPGTAAAQGAGPFATPAKVQVGDANGPVQLKREEQIALMFLKAIESVEGECQRHAGGACTLAQLVAGPAATDGWRIGRLKFDPASDPNYRYAIRVAGDAWEAYAAPQRPGLGGFYLDGRVGFIAKAYFNPAGQATAQDRRLSSSSIVGDTFTTH